MNLRKINESFTSLYGNDKYLKESVDYDSLEYKLNQAVEDTMKGENRNNIKYYEDALQKAIEDMYPDKSWWDITDLNIFWHLFENKDPYLTVKAIIDNLKPEYRNERLTESIADSDSEALECAQMSFESGHRFEKNDFEDSEAYNEYLKYMEMGPAGFYEEFKDELDFDEDFIAEYGEIDESLKEDTVKLKSGKWTNKGDTGKTHGTFRTKKAADAQRKAMFAQGYKAEGIEETKEEELLVEKSGKNTLKAEFDKILNSLGESELKEGKTTKGLSLKQEFDNILNSIKNESIEESMELPIDKPMSKLKGTLSNIMSKNQKELAGVSNRKEAIEFLDKIEPQVKNKHYLNSIKLQLQKTPDYKAQTFLYNIILKGDGMRSF